MKTIIKTLIRFKTSTALNIIGLSTAFAAFILIGMQIRYDLTYDTHNENYDSIYMLGYEETESKQRDYWFNRQIPIEIRNTLSEIEYLSIFGQKFDDRITILGENEKENQYETIKVNCCDPDLTNIFTFEFIEGDGSALKDPNSVIISSKFSEKWYGKKSPIGKKIMFGENIYTISALYKSFPSNSTLQGDIFCNIGDDNINNSNNYNYNVYIKLSDGADINIVNDKYATIDLGKDYKSTTALVPDTIQLSEIRYTINGYDRRIIYTMIIIILSIIVLASINFINFAASMVPLKIKGINVRKISGATNRELRANMICESIILTIVSFLIALLFVELFKDSPLNNIIADTKFATNHIVYIAAIAIAIFTGVVSGLYPAFYSTSFAPALVLKGCYALSASGSKFRKALIGFQFFVTLSFIASTIFIQLQHNYMLNKDGGYIKEEIIHVYHGWNYDKQELLKNELLKNPQIKDVTFSYLPFGIEQEGMSWGRTYSKGYFNITSLPVADNFLDFFEIKIDSGRNFIQNDNYSENGYFIMSNIAMEKYDFTPGEKISGHREATQIVGVCENIQLTNLKVKLEPYAFYIFGKYPWTNLAHAYIKSSGNSADIVEQIKTAYNKTDPNLLINTKYLTDELHQAYQSENTTKQIMQSFSLIAIIIALVGVFGLVTFDTKYRRKEIAIRKINGATVKEILMIFGFGYIKIALVSFVLSVPMVIYFISAWLKQFPYRIEIYWWVFAVALLMVLTLTITISIIQSLRVARENPIKAINKE